LVEREVREGDGGIRGRRRRHFEGGILMDRVDERRFWGAEL
jgi:hypothetical protein